MRKLVVLVVVALMALSLSACATNGHVKCPQCGYEFNAPAQT